MVEESSSQMRQTCGSSKNPCCDPRCMTVAFPSALQSCLPVEGCSPTRAASTTHHISVCISSLDIFFLILYGMYLTSCESNFGIIFLCEYTGGDRCFIPATCSGYTKLQTVFPFFSYPSSCIKTGIQPKM